MSKQPDEIQQLLYSDCDDGPVDSAVQREKDQGDIKKLCGIAHALTRWETDFADSLWNKCIDDSMGLSEKQRAKLQQLLEQHA